MGAAAADCCGRGNCGSDCAGTGSRRASDPSSMSPLNKLPVVLRVDVYAWAQPSRTATDQSGGAVFTLLGTLGAHKDIPDINAILSKP